MCYAIPGRLVEIKDNIGVVDYFGERRNVLFDFGDVSVGDYVYVQAGLLINKIEARQAEEILESWKELFFELKKVDAGLAKVHGVPSSKAVSDILNKVDQDEELKRGDLSALLQIEDKKVLRLLYETANDIRQKKHGNACCVHGIIEFSNYCKNNCLYCGIRNERNIQRYRMEIEEIIAAAKYAVLELKFKALVLQSGEDYWYDEKKLLALIKEIRKLGVLIFLSIGQRGKGVYRRLFEAGARGVLLRFEASNKDIFRAVKPGTTIEERLGLIRYLKNLGYCVATGFLTGLPRGNDDDIINDILLAKSLEPDMYSFGPFIPVKDTPLEDERLVDKDTMLKIIAISRLIDKNANILVTTALKTMDKTLEREGLLAGANSLMINVTPKNYRSLYRIYDNRSDEKKEIGDAIRDTLDLLYSLGRAPVDLGARS